MGHVINLTGETVRILRDATHELVRVIPTAKGAVVPHIVCTYSRAPVHMLPLKAVHRRTLMYLPEPDGETTFIVTEQVLDFMRDRGYQNLKYYVAPDMSTAVRDDAGEIKGIIQFIVYM
jgi:hypothetical protein